MNLFLDTALHVINEAASMERSAKADSPASGSNVETTDPRFSSDNKALLVEFGEGDKGGLCFP